MIVLVEMIFLHEDFLLSFLFLRALEDHYY